MYLLEKRLGPKGVVRYREVSVIWDVRYKEVLLYSCSTCNKKHFERINRGRGMVKIWPKSV